MMSDPRPFNDAFKAMYSIIAALKEDDWNSRAEMAERVQEHIRYLESQLAARNQAAEAMGVLDRLVEERGFVTIQQGLRTYSVQGHEGDTTIEAVLKAGGEG